MVGILLGLSVPSLPLRLWDVARQKSETTARKQEGPGEAVGTEEEVRGGGLLLRGAAEPVRSRADDAVKHTKGRGGGSGGWVSFMSVRNKGSNAEWDGEGGRGMVLHTKPGPIVFLYLFLLSRSPPCLGLGTVSLSGPAGRRPSGPFAACHTSTYGLNLVHREPHRPTRSQRIVA